MISLELKNTKSFMKHLLLSNTFDHFLFIEGEIVTFNTFTLDGYLQKNFFEPDTVPPHQYSSWGQIRELCFSIIKGKRTPLRFRFIFSLSPSNIAKLVERHSLDFSSADVQGLYLNIRFEDGLLQCVTGTSLKTFSMDKSLEKLWDQTAMKFFLQQGIDFEKAD